MMDWLKTEKGTPDKPETIAIAATLALGRDETFGKLFRIWSWADSHTINGKAKVSPLFVDQFVNQDGFADAMISVGWLVSRNGYIEFPNFERHMGENSKKRADAAYRKFKSRQNVTESCDKGVTREEKRREEKEEPPDPPKFFEPPVKKPGEEDPGWLARQWINQLRRNPLKDEMSDATKQFTEWIRVGIAPATIEADILDPNRTRTERLWDLEKRFFEKGKPRKTAKSAAAESANAIGATQAMLDREKGIKK